MRRHRAERLARRRPRTPPRRAVERLEDRTLLASVPSFDPAAAVPLSANGRPVAVDLGAGPRFFKLGTDGGRLVATLDSVGGVRLSLLDRLGNLLVTSDGATASGPDPRIVLGVAPGTLYLEAEARPAPGAGPRTATLTASLTPSTDPFASLPPLQPPSTAVAAADVNGDGLPDEITGSGVFLGTGDGAFTHTPVWSPQDPSPGAVAVGRFTGGGAVDLALAYGGSISVLRGAGDGTFASAGSITLAPGRTVRALAAGDFGSGSADLAVLEATPTGRVVEVWRNTGGGSFVRGASVSVDRDAVAVAAGRFNGDARTDLAVLDAGGTNGPGRVVLLRGLAGGGFASGPVITLAGGEDEHAIAAGDFDGDGGTELAVAGTADAAYGLGGVTLLTPDGRGSFSPRARVSVPRDLGGLAAADVNRDGRADLLATNVLTPAVTVLLARGGGTFESVSPPDPAPIAVADVNGDGIPDYATPSGVFLGNGDGSFRPAGDGRAVGGAATSAIVAGRFVGGDDNVDLAVADADQGTVTVLKGDGRGGFTTAETVDVRGHPSSLLAFGNNERTDLAVTDPVFGTVTVLANDGTGTFRPGTPMAVGLRPAALAAVPAGGETALAVAGSDPSGAGAVAVVWLGPGGTSRYGGTYPVGDGPSAVASADLDGDGVPDLAVADLASGSVSVLLGDGRGGFRGAAPVVLGPGSDPTAVVALPAPGRGADLAVAERGTFTVRVLRNTGGGTFRVTDPVSFSQPPTGLAAARFTGGGAVDLAVADLDAADVAVLPGRADGTFGSPTRNPLGSAPAGAAVGLFDRDGTADVAVVNSQSGTVSVLLGNGDGTFRGGASLPAGANPYAVVTADFNGDGRADLAVTDYGDGVSPGEVRVFLGHGDGTFQSGQVIPAGVGTWSLAAGDLDGTHRTDLAVIDQGSLDDQGPGDLRILLNNGDGTFRTGATYPVGGQPSSVVASDLDGDGATDVAVADTGWPGSGIPGDVRVFWGRGSGGLSGPTTVPYDGPDQPGPASLVAGDFGGPGTGTGRLAVLVQYPDPSLHGFVDVLGVDPARKALTTVSHTPLSLDDFPSYLAAGVFGRSGRTGLAVVEPLTGAVVVLDPRDGGGYDVGDPVPVGLVPGQVVAADFNGDGQTDFAVPTQLPNVLTVRLGASGDFTDPGDAALEVRDTPVPAALRPGVTDLLSVDGEGNILWRRGRRGDPAAFDPPVVINPGFPSRGVAFVPAGAGGGVGGLVASVDLGRNAVSLYAYQGDALRRVGALATGRIPAQVVAGDVDGDGRADLVVRNAGDGTASVFLNAGDGSFAAGPVVDLGPHVADLDLGGGAGAPGRPDLLAADESGAVEVRPNLGGGAFGAPVPYRAGAGATGLAYATVGATRALQSWDATAGVAAGWLTRPGGGAAGPSLVVADPGSQTLAVLDGLGGGAFADARTVAAGEPARVVLPFSFLAGGRTSGVAALGPGGLTVYRDDGAGGLARVSTLDAGTDPTGLAAADVDGDGRTELLVGNRYGDVLVYHGDGRGGFRPATRVDPRTYLAVAGAAPDGRPVFAVSDQRRDLVGVGVGVRGGPPAPLPPGSGAAAVRAPGPVASADLGGSGAADLVVANGGGNSLLIYPGLGGGRFGAPTAVPVGDDPVSVSVADLNGDGVPDLVAANHGSNDVSVVLGAARGGSWSPRAQIRLKAGSGPTATAVARVLGGPGPDIVVTSGASNDVRVLPALGAGFFDDAHPLVFPTGLDPVGVLPVRSPGLAGTTDLLTWNAGSNDLTLVRDPGSGLASSVNVPSGGQVPIAAVTRPDPVTGGEEVFVANAGDGRLSVLQVTADGLTLLRTFSEPALPHPAALATDAFGDVFGVDSGADGAVLVAAALGLVASPPGGARAVDAADTAGGLEEQLVANLGSLGGLALAATLMTVLVEPAGEPTAGGPGAGAGAVALALAGGPLNAIPQPARGPAGGPAQAYDPGGATEPPGAAPAPQGPDNADALIGFVFGLADEFQDVGREVQHELAQEPAPAPSASPLIPTPLTPAPAVDGLPADRAAEAAPPAGPAVDAALAALNGDRPTGRKTRPGARVARPPTAPPALVAAVALMSLSLAVGGASRRRHHRTPHSGGASGGRPHPEGPP